MNEEIEQEEIQYSVPFVLNELENKVVFNSKDEKDTYLKNERKFCIDEYTKFAGAMDVDNRIKFKIELEKKRMAFAVHSGFKEVRKTGIWNHYISKDAKELA